MSTIYFLFLLLFSLNRLLISSTNFHLPSFLTEKIESDGKIKEIIWLVNNESSIGPEVVKTIPSLVIDYYQEKLEISSIIDFPTTLIVTSVRTLPIDDFLFLDFLNRLIDLEQRPKVLLLKSQSPKSFDNVWRKFLKFMWSNRFLDVTILEVRKNARGNFLWEQFAKVESVAVVVQRFFNPFTRRFTEGEIGNVSVQLFPNKVQNLFGYKMKVGYFHYPPYVRIIRNQSRALLTIEGPDYELVKIMGETMNFQIKEIVSNQSTWDIQNCVREKNTGFVHDLIFNKIHFLGVQSGRSLTLCPRRFFKSIVHNFGQIHYSAVTPIETMSNNLFIVELKLFYLIVILLLFATVWFLPRILHFDSKHWQCLEIERIILGASALIEPKKASERFFLIFTLITTFLLSSALFTSLTSINLVTNSQILIDSLNELFASKYTPVIAANIRKLFQVERKNVANYVQRAVFPTRHTDTDEKCIEFLLVNKNITCFMRSVNAEHEINKRKKFEDGKFSENSIHMVGEYLADLFLCLMCEPGFPFVTRFQTIFTRLQQTGIPYTWRGKFFSSSSVRRTLVDDLTSELDESNLKTMENLVGILLFGFSCATLAFIGETIFHYCLSRFLFFKFAVEKILSE